MLVKFQPLLKKTVGRKPWKMTNSCFRDFQTALVIERCRKSVDDNFTVFSQETQPFIFGYIDRVLRGETILNGKCLFQEIFSSDRRGRLFVQLRYTIEQLINRHFHRRSLELTTVIARFDDLVSLQQLCQPAVADSLAEYYYSLATVRVTTSLVNQAFVKALDGFGLPGLIKQAASTVEWGSIWMATAGFTPAVETQRCAARLNQALQGMMTNWQLTIKQELLRALTVLLYDLHDQTIAVTVQSERQVRPKIHHQIYQQLRQAV
jgi:hypothetical protein